jgi:pimeloyl-ACP methyl ester carboxylesterase
MTDPELVHARSSSRDEHARVERRLDSFSWVEQGVGRPVVFLHPIVGTRHYWDAQLAGLSDQFRCIALDAPGYGGQPSDQLTPAELGARVIEFLDALDISQVDLVGLSLGGMHALYALNVAPDRIRRAVLADTSLAFGADPDEWLSDWLAPINDGGTPAGLAIGAIDAIVAKPLPDAVRHPLGESFSRVTEAALRQASETIAHHNVTAIASGIDNPSLVICGELDGETPLEYSQALAAALPNGELAVIAGAGHLSSIEHPQTFNEITRNFLA